LQRLAEVNLTPRNIHVCQEDISRKGAKKRKREGAKKRFVQANLEPLSPRRTLRAFTLSFLCAFA
jgi:hypothetical protein